MTTDDARVKKATSVDRRSSSQQSSSLNVTFSTFEECPYVIRRNGSFTVVDIRRGIANTGIPTTVDDRTIRAGRRDESIHHVKTHIVLSVYGVIGSLKPELVAAITCIIRSTLLKEARLAVTMGRRVYYCDTDCIHVSGGSTDEELSTLFNSIYPFIQVKKNEKKPMRLRGSKCVLQPAGRQNKIRSARKRSGSLAIDDRIFRRGDVY